MRERRASESGRERERESEEREVVFSKLLGWGKAMRTLSKLCLACSEDWQRNGKERSVFTLGIEARLRHSFGEKEEEANRSACRTCPANLRTGHGLTELSPRCHGCKAKR